MQVNITARHLHLTPALTDYVQKKVERVAGHFRAMIRAQVILSVEKHRHIAEVIVHSNQHRDFRAKEESTDLYAAVDLVTEMLHKHLAREKDKRVRGRRREKVLPMEMPFPLLPLNGGDEEASNEPTITRMRRFSPKSMTVSEAAEEMKRNKYSFLIFINDDVISILYVRKDKTYGLMEANL